MFSRLLSRLGLFAAPLFALAIAGCSKADLSVRQSTLDPKGPVAQMQYDVFMDTVWLVIVLFVLVGGLLVYAVVRFRSRPGDTAAPIVEEGHGNPLVEIGLITPPVGMNVFIISAMAKNVQMKEIFKAILPFLASDIIRITLLVFFPGIALIALRVFS